MNKRRRIYLGYITQFGKITRSVGNITTYNKALNNVIRELNHAEEAHGEGYWGLSYVIVNTETKEVIE